jgi:HK97 family phage prohead protease
MNELEVRTSQVADVSFPKRMIELIVMPYESETTIERPHRTWTEIVSRGAFDGVELRTSQIKVNRSHRIDQPVGKTLALHPSRREGLVAELRISETPLGDETLTLADDGVLEASAGFSVLRKNGRTGAVVPGAEVWETRSRRRLNRLFLGHIAMTPEPAYDGARVLAVRTTTHDAEEDAGAATPNLDRLQLESWRTLAADLDRRYGLVR